MLFSGEVDIDHILPYSKTWDDSPANKIVCLAEANKFKRNRSPWEAWGDTEQWEAIAERAQQLPGNKRWRFAPDAMEQFAGQGGFLARQLMETQYLSRMARKYLMALYADRPDENPVWVTPGRLTEMLRRRWGLNALLHDHNQYDTNKPKNRQDHRHHAIDAAVIALTDRSFLNRISREAGRMEAEGLEDFVWRSIPEEPWENFRKEMRGILENMVVSHRPRHKIIDFSLRRLGRDRTAGRLHNDTAYGLTGGKSEKGVPLVVHRVPLENIKSEKDIHKIRDAQLRDALWDFTRGLSGKEFTRALIDFANQDKLDGKPNPFRGIRRVRITEPLHVIPIKDRKGRPYKGYKGDSNYRYDVWELPDGRWKATVISMFDAHQPDHEAQKPHPAAKRRMKIFQNDMCAWEKDGRLVYGRVVKFGQNGQITLAPHNEANTDARNRDKNDAFRYYSPAPGGLKNIKFRLLRVDETGYFHDPGPLA
jgi:CRISPR-associated endonuclease Csn1